MLTEPIQAEKLKALVFSALRRFNQMTGKMERVVSSPLPQPSSTSANAGRGPYFAAGGGGGGGGLQQLYTSDQPNLSLGVADEYNPICPNDFEELARKKRDKRKADVSFVL